MRPLQRFTVMIIAMMTGGNAISVKDGTKTVVTVTTIKKTTRPGITNLIGLFLWQEIQLNYAASASQQANDKQNQEYDKADLGDAGRCRCHSAKTKNRRQKGDNQKHPCVPEHIAF